MKKLLAAAILLPILSFSYEINFNKSFSKVVNPDLLTTTATTIHWLPKRFGSQCIVVAIDVKKVSDGSYHVFVKGGREYIVTGKQIGRASCRERV